jgi:hypothetical protein
MCAAIAPHDLRNGTSFLGMADFSGVASPDTHDVFEKDYGIAVEKAPTNRRLVT